MNTQEAQWHAKPFAQLSGTEVYALLALRQQVFVVEQRCAYLDADGRDAEATHIYTLDASQPHVALACARVFAPGVKYAEASVGRVVSAASQRRTGLGRACVARALAHIEAVYGAVPARISAQAYLERFYGEFGFARVGANYLEDDVPHLAMLRSPRAS